MAFRFRRRVRLMPGVHLNFSSGGVSVSAGVRGASVTAGRRGIHANTGIPGTGLSWRRRLDAPKPRDKVGAVDQVTTSFEVRLRLQDTGEVIVEGSDGQPLGGRQLKKLRDEKGEIVEQWLQDAVNKLNSDYESCIGVHLSTPSPLERAGIAVEQDLLPEPLPPSLRSVGLVDRLLLRRKRIERHNQSLMDDYDAAASEWQASSRHAKELTESARLLVEAAQGGHLKAMEYVLSRRLEKLPWPRETSVNFECSADGRSLQIDTDLAEIEDMPTRIATVAGRGIKVTFKERTEAQVRRDYLRLVDGTIFRVLGEAFSSLPTIQVVTASGYTQRADPATGQEIDDYVISVRANRAAWEEIDFKRLAAFTPGEALERFELSRSVDKSGRLRTAEPLNSTA